MFVYLKGPITGRKEEAKRDLLYSGSLPKWLRQLGMGHSKAASFIPVSHLKGGAQRLEPSSASFSDTLAGSWMATEQSGLEPVLI